MASFHRSNPILANPSSKTLNLLTTIQLNSDNGRMTERQSNLLSQPPTEQRDEDMVLLTPPVMSRFNAGHFAKASQIIRALKEPDLKLKRPIFWTDDERILSYELIVAILKYATFLNDALDKSMFFQRHPDMEEEEVMVVLYNLLELGFRVNPNDIPLSDKFADVQNAVLASRTKIMAHMARIRIKHEANSIDHLLPENLRHQHHIDKNPLYAWINLKKISPDEVTDVLKRVGLTQTEFEDDILIQERLFCIVQNHPDLLRFHSKKTEMIHGLSLSQDGKIIIQDKSACIYVYALVKALFFKEAINRNTGLSNLNPVPIAESMVPVTSKTSNEWYDGILDGSGKYYVKPDCVIVTHCGSGRSAAHLACLLMEAVPRYISKPANIVSEGDLCKSIQSKFISRPPLIVLAFGVPDQKHEEVSRVFRKQLGLTNFRLYTEDFCDVSKKDPRVKGAAAILVNPPSSGSALKDPVSYICSEGGDENVLAQYSKFVTSTLNTEGYQRYTADQVKFLSHALSFSQVKLILYTTCSSLRCENLDVVKTCLADIRAKEEARKSNVFANIMTHKPTRVCFREVSFEIVNLAKVMEGYPESHFQGNFIEIPPSSASSGVFVALIRRKEKSINLGKNPMRNFIASQLALSTSKAKMGSTTTLSSLDSSLASFPTGLINDDELARYIAKKMNINFDNPEVQFQLDENYNRASAIIPWTPSIEKPGKRKLSKKAIVQRVSVPTYASLAKKTDKWLGTSESKTASKSVQGVKSKPSQSGTSGRKPFGNIAPSVIACTHDPGACICSRHAKKFPDFLKRQS